MKNVNINNSPSFLWFTGMFCIINFLLNLLFVLFPDINITPFSRSQLLSIIVITPINYLFLGPWHELGHYYKAKQFLLSKKCNVTFCLKRNYISCSDWSVFEENENIEILKSGALSKITFCGQCIIIALITYNFFLVVSFIYVILFEYYQNCTLLFDKNDYYYTYHIEEFVREPKYMNGIKMDSFIKNIYPRLIKIYFVLYVIFCIIFLLNKVFQLVISNKIPLG